MRLAVLAAAVTLAAACRVPDVDREYFSCRKDPDCGNGWVCVRGVCVLESSPEARRDAGGEPECKTPCGSERQLCCAGDCVDPATSREHCGACGKACAPLENCVAGACLRESGRDACRNERDDDADGRIDCADVDDCGSGTACRTGTCCDGECRREMDATLCSNGLDDDCDGRIDCDDPDCAGVSCASGRVCEGSACLAGCSIEGSFRAREAFLPTRPCLRCEPAVSAVSWTAVARLSSSGACTGSLACDGEGRCRRRPGEPCAGDSDCATQRCAEGRCVP